MAASTSPAISSSGNLSLALATKTPSRTANIRFIIKAGLNCPGSDNSADQENSIAGYPYTRPCIARLSTHSKNERGSMMGRSGEIETNRSSDRRRLLRTGILALPFLFSIRPVRAVERVGSVEDITGVAFAELQSVRRTLSQAAPVFLNEEVMTGIGSRLGMRLGAHTTVRLGEQARLKIDRFVVDAGGEITLSSGPLLFDGPPHHAGIQVRSPFALIAVRDTRFFAGPSNDRFGVF